MLRLGSLLVVGAAAVVIVGLLPAVGQDHPDQSSSGGDLFCSLNDDEQREASDAWASLVPTFHHPRCSNCHGGVDPFSDDGGHLGGAMPIFRTDSDFGKVDDLERTFGECQQCHGGLEGWTVPPEEMNFAGRSGTQICVQMKRFFHRPQRFLYHIEHDVGPVNFIREAFRGTRGLNERGRDNFEAEAERPFAPEPPPTTHAAFLAQARAWAGRFGEEFPGFDTGTGGRDPCGCVPVRYELRFDSRITIDWGEVKVTEQVRFTAPLQRDESEPTARFEGSAPLEVVDLSMQVEGCRANVRSTGETARVEVTDHPGLVASISPGMTNMTGTMTCQGITVPAQFTTGLWTPTWYALHQAEVSNGVGRFQDWEFPDRCDDAGCQVVAARKTIERRGQCEDAACTSETKIEIWEITGQPGRRLN